MKVIRLFLFATLCVGLLCIGTSCEPVPDIGDQEEIGNGNGGSDDNLGDNLADDSGNEPGGGDSGSMAAADIFKAFDKVGNEFWYYEESGGSYVSYGGRQSYSNARVIAWDVVSATANEATVNEYVDFDFSKPTAITFSHDSDGSLLVGGKKVTNTQSPDFLTMYIEKKGSYECKELYNDGAYTNTFYTKGNSYTTTKISHDMTEVWNEYGFFSSRYSNMSDDATVGSSYKNWTLKRAETAYNSFGSNTKPDGVTITGIENTTEIFNNYTYFKQNPDARAFKVDFTHNGQNTCAYCFGMYLKGNDGESAWFPVYSINDIRDYVKGFYNEYNEYYPGGDKLVKPLKNISSGPNSIELILTPAAIELGRSIVNKRLYFCIFALGYGSDMVSTIDEAKAVFGIDFSEPSTTSQIMKGNSVPVPVSLKQR
jgi:hypothetical protein